MLSVTTLSKSLKLLILLLTELTMLPPLSLVSLTPPSVPTSLVLSNDSCSEALPVDELPEAVRSDFGVPSGALIRLSVLGYEKCKTVDSALLTRCGAPEMELLALGGLKNLGGAANDGDGGNKIVLLSLIVNEARVLTGLDVALRASYLLGLDFRGFGRVGTEV